MKRKVLLSLFVLFLLVTGCNNKENKTKEEKNANTNVIDTNEKEEVNMLKIYINNEEYDIDLENNETVKELINLLPLEVTMNELNGNEKYIYLDSKLSTNSSNPKHINAGDVMLYGNNCLVIFYESFDTSYSYTRIGHINNLPNLGNGNIKVKIENKD